MWIDSVIEYDIIVETLTGTEIEVTVTDDDTIGYIKTHIQKYEGKTFGMPCMHDIDTPNTTRLAYGPHRCLASMHTSQTNKANTFRCTKCESMKI